MNRIYVCNVASQGPETEAPLSLPTMNYEQPDKGPGATGDEQPLPLPAMNYGKDE